MIEDQGIVRIREAYEQPRVMNIRASDLLSPASHAGAVEMLSVFGVNGARLVGAKPMLPRIRQSDVGHYSVVLKVHC